MIRKKAIALSAVFLLTLVGSITLFSPTAKAVSAPDWQAGRIIDDAIFTDPSAMSVDQIQNFLNGKVGTGGYDSIPGQCDGNGTRNAQPFSSASRANYADSLNRPNKFTCLNGYYEVPKTQPGPGIPANNYGTTAIPTGARSAAQLIWDAAQRYSISPKVLLVTIQKESAGPLTTDDWPFQKQYTYAMGAHCPDSGPGGAANCDENYAGFSIQISESAALLRYYLDNMDQPWWSYKKVGNNEILFQNSKPECGSTTVNITTRSTAALYTYTPYQPNQAALNNLYGLGDGCSAYGNRNFWRIYSDWFGTTHSDEYGWSVIRTATDSKLFLQVGNTKRWIPSGDIYTGWTLDKYPTNIISDTDFNNIPTIPELTRLGNNGQYNYIVESGVKHYLPPQYISLWAYQNTIAAPVTSLLRFIPENAPMGRFINQNGSSDFWIINSGVKHAVSINDLASWGYSPDNVVSLGQTYLPLIPVGISVNRFVKSDNTSYIVDQGSLIRLPNDVIANAWSPSGYTTINSLALSVMPTRGGAGLLVRASNSSAWFMIEAGSKYYVPTGNIALNWGMNYSTIIETSPDLLSKYPTLGNLTNFAKDPTNQKVYVLDGEKHHILNGALLSTLVPAADQILTISNTHLNYIPDGISYTKPFINIKNTPHVFLLDSGKKYHVTTSDLYNAYNSFNGTLALSGTLIDDLPFASQSLGGIFKDLQGTSYLADGGSKHQIDASVSASWVNLTSPTFSNELKDLLATSTTSINTRYLKLGSLIYFMDRGSKNKISGSMVTSYVGASSVYTQNNDTLQTVSGEANFLLRSIDDQKMWFINKTSKTEVNFPTQVTLGYLSSSRYVASTTNTFLNQFPTAPSSSLLIRKENDGGVKFLNFGHSLGFPDSEALLNTISSTNPVIVVDDFIYDSFPLIGSITRIIKDDAGKIYVLQNGQRRWFTNSNTYQPYSSIPITYLYGTTMALIPEGQAIN